MGYLSLKIVLSLVCTILLYTNLFILTDAAKSKKSSKKSSEELKMDQDRVRASLGAARDSLVQYITSPAFSIGSEMIIGKIIDFLTEIETQEIQEVFELLQNNPTLVKTLTSKFMADVQSDDNEWSDPEKAYELIRTALKTFSELENPQAYFHSLIKILGTNAKNIVQPKDEL